MKHFVYDVRYENMKYVTSLTRLLYGTKQPPYILVLVLVLVRGNKALLLLYS